MDTGLSTIGANESHPATYEAQDMTRLKLDHFKRVLESNPDAEERSQKAVEARKRRETARPRRKAS